MNQPGWFGHPEQLLYVLGTVHADRDEDGNFLIYTQPVFTGLEGDVVVPGDVEYAVGGKRANLAALMRATSYGVSVTVIA